jgi:hypothetical protein
MKKNLKFSFFHSNKGIQNCNPKGEIDLNELFSLLKSSFLEELTGVIRETTDEEVKIELKLRLPYITPYGTFSYRDNKSITSYNSNLIALDFDNLDEITINYIRETIIQSKRAYYVGVSPRGKGIKALIFAGCNFNTENHYLSLKNNSDQILKYLGLDPWTVLDTNQFKLSQPFFLSYDERAYFNYEPFTLVEDFEILKPYEKEAHIYNNNIPLSEVSEESKKRIGRVLEGLYQKLGTHYKNTPEGSRHNSIVKVSNFASYLRQYLPEKETYYKERLLLIVEGMYSDKERITSRFKESFEVAWDKEPFGYCEPLEKINTETTELKKVVNCFLNGEQCEYKGENYKGNETTDKIIITPNGVKWTYNGYSLAYKRNDSKEFTIKVLGVPFPDKLERLNLLPNVDIFKAIDILILNGKQWDGKEIMLNSNTVEL